VLGEPAHFQYFEDCPSKLSLECQWFCIVYLSISTLLCLCVYIHGLTVCWAVLLILLNVMVSRITPVCFVVPTVSLANGMPVPYALA